MASVFDYQFNIGGNFTAAKKTQPRVQAISIQP